MRLIPPTVETPYVAIIHTPLVKEPVAFTSVTNAEHGLTFALEEAKAEGCGESGTTERGSVSMYVRRFFGIRGHGARNRAGDLVEVLLVPDGELAKDHPPPPPSPVIEPAIEEAHASTTIVESAAAEPVAHADHDASEEIAIQRAIDEAGAKARAEELEAIARAAEIAHTEPAPAPEHVSESTAPEHTEAP